MSLIALDANAPHPLHARLLLLAYELLFSVTTSFLLTFALLPVLDLHPAPLLVLRVTGLFTVAIFVLLDVLVETARRHRSANIPTNSPKFVQRSSAGDAEAGWPPEKVEGMECTAA
ncbi:hypothetical protein FB451DRAFT_1553965 [Mycena latifolia]|nr:hypothetical protein FB451DRAFT_1553965 [Mycena latifolia]